MAKLLLLFAAAALCVCFVTAQSSTTELSSEQHIKNLVNSVDCTDCNDEKGNVIAKTDKDQICKSYIKFKTCVMLHCFSKLGRDAFTDTDDICDGCSALQMSMIVLFLASIVKILF